MFRRWILYKQDTRSAWLFEFAIPLLVASEHLYNAESRFLRITTFLSSGLSVPLIAIPFM